jgi:glycosyltransferase involved in cell wall biosynthesis
MRRIVHYYPGAHGHSGVTFALWSWARAQAAAGAEVCVLAASDIAPGSDVPFVSHDPDRGLTTVAVPHRGSHRLTRRPVGLDRCLGTNDLLVLHEGWVPSNIIAAAAARRLGVPYIVMPHGVYDRLWTTYLKGPRALRRLAERHLLEHAAAVHIFFESEAEDIRAIAPAARFITIPAGLEVPADRWTGGGGYIGWLGRIDPTHKGLDVLVGAFAELAPAERMPLRIRGYDYKGGLARLLALIRQRGLERWISVEPAVAGADKRRFMQQADGYAHPSRWECLGITLLEHLALGVPCVVSQTIHLAPLLAKSGAAVLTRLDERSIAEALVQLPRERERLTARGRDFISDRFNWSALMPQFHAALHHAGVN